MSHYRVIFTTGIPITGKMFYIETGPWSQGALLKIRCNKMMWFKLPFSNTLWAHLSTFDHIRYQNTFIYSKCVHQKLLRMRSFDKFCYFCLQTNAIDVICKGRDRGIPCCCYFFIRFVHICPPCSSRRLQKKGGGSISIRQRLPIKSLYWARLSIEQMIDQPIKFFPLNDVFINIFE